MNRTLLKKLIYITVSVLLVLVLYKGYLVFVESTYHDSNIETVEALEKQTGQEPYSFYVVGSIRNSLDVFQQKMIPEIQDSGGLFLISTGNAVLDGAEDKYRILNNAFLDLEKPVIVVPGPDEMSDGGDRRFYDHFGPFYFSFPFGDSYFICLDTSGMTSMEYQTGWLENELAAAAGYGNIFVIMNDSPVASSEAYTGYGAVFAGNETLRRDWIRMLSEAQVSAVFTNGSTKFAEVTQGGVPYYESGGGGGVSQSGMEGSSYHYLTVTVSSEGVTVVPQDQEMMAGHFFTKRIEGLWIRIHAVFYAMYLNLLLGFTALLLLFLILYRKASQDVDYYRNFRPPGRGGAEVRHERPSLRIAMFTNNYVPFVGGVPISIEGLAAALRKRGHQVTVFAPEYPDYFKVEEHVIRFPLLCYLRTKQFDYAMVNLLSSNIEKQFYRGNYDLVHVHHPFWFGGKGRQLARKYHKPVVLTYHTRYELYSKNLPFLKLVFKNIISHRMIKRFAQKCDAVLVPTLSAKEYLEHIGVSRYKMVLPTGIDLAAYGPEQQSAAETLRNRLTPKGEKLLCMVSRLSVEKNIAFLLEGLALVREKTKVPFRCVLVGDGPERERLTALAGGLGLSGTAIFEGAVDKAHLPGYYMASDLFVFTSVSETQGMVLLEAMAGGCPVVSVVSSGTDDLVRDGITGYKTDQDLEEWAARVTELLEDDPKRSAMGNHAREDAAGYSMDKMAERAESFYLKAIELNETFKKEHLDEKSS